MGRRLILLVLLPAFVLCQLRQRPAAQRSRRPPLPELRRPERQPPQNRPPILQEGSDLVGFQINEDTPVGSVVYTLKGVDPEGARVLYTISGDHFSVNRETGIITLRAPLDREEEELLDVVVTIQDEAFEHIVPFRRQIRVIDKNDNAPTFVRDVYKFDVDETEPVGETLFAKIGISDRDDGANAVVELSCDEEASPEACDTFEIKAQLQSLGNYIGLVTLKKKLDFEARSSYDMVVKAQDSGVPSLSSTSNILIEVNDIQDQKPFFVNAPYSVSIPENVPEGTEIFEIKVRDGDTGIPRKLDLTISGDNEGFFELENLGQSSDGILTASLRKTAGNVLDRELPSILREGGLYAFQLRAREILEDNVNFGEEATANVTLVITDVDDMIPTFNRDDFTVAVPEDVGQDTPLPDLNMMVSDGDISNNAAYDLVLESLENADGVFAVYPEKAVGRTPVIIRVVDPDRLDHESETGRRFILVVKAVQNGQVLNSATVTIMVKDANDNVPIFESDSYQFNLREDVESGDYIGKIAAFDADSGDFGQVEYALRGFGADKFRVNPETGDLYVSECGAEFLVACLDYETQRTFALTYTGTDGGGQITTTSVTINIQDVNDNYPRFEVKSYKRDLPEGATTFEPALIVKATDNDGPNQGNGQVFYSIKSINTDATIFGIDPVTGEMSIIQPVRSDQVENGLYSLVVRATDAGTPPLHSDVKVTVSVGSNGNQRPIFGQPSYEATIKEDTEINTFVLKIDAQDPDGPSDLIEYSLDIGAKDNFVIDKNTGEIRVSRDAMLDIQENGDIYQIKVQAMDSGRPFGQTAEVPVTIYIEDVNDKSPKFEKEVYTMYVLESVPVGEPVLKVLADDVDRNAQLEYSLVEPITARDKTGNILTNRAGYDFSTAFAINPKTGQIVVNEPLSYSSAAVIILTIKVTDLNADLKVESTEKPFNNQFDTVEATFYIQAYKADSPQFAAPWTPSDPVLRFDVKEELPIGTVLFKLTARDPLTGQTVNQYEKLPDSDPQNLIDISPVTGEVINNQILDYERMKEVVLRVRAKAGVPSQERTSDATITIKLQDVNDNYPQFNQNEYSASILESALPASPVITVSASDQDTGKNGKIVYSIEGEGSDAFTIHPEEGHIQVKATASGRSNLDRERLSEYRLQVVASDTPDGGPNKKSTSTLVYISLEDVNDTPPIFSQPQYSAVVPENSPRGTLVTQVMASDPDLGASGQVSFEFPESLSSLKDLYKIDSDTGAITTNGKLTGKGRAAPYVLTVRAIDKGVPQLFSDTEVYVTVGDVSSNDGMPQFIKPEVNQVAYVPENSQAGTKVFQVEAYDPDDPNTANGKIVYSLPDDGTIIRKLFQIDSETGILSTKIKLDREERQNYTLILDISDLGSPPQQSSRLMNVVVTDVDDHAPVFKRQRNSVPIELEVMEEIPLGSQIGQVYAVDQDEGENAVIEYAIIDGNDNRVFGISRGEDNQGVLTIEKRLDREEIGVYLLTIKCFRPYERSLKSAKSKYYNGNLDEIQVKINVQDVDDNAPRFLSQNLTLGVRVNSPIYTEVAVLQAEDTDADSGPVNYYIEKILYYRPRSSLKEIVDNHVFIIDQLTGVLQTNETYARFTDGFFEITVKAKNAPSRQDLVKIKEDMVKVKVFVLQDTELMRFVFDRDPTSVQKKLPEFKNDLEGAFAQPLKFNIYDAEFYSKVDGSLDFGRTSSCFQIMSDDQVVDLKTSESIFTNNQDELQQVYDLYNIVDVERCSEIFVTKRIQWVEMSLIAIAALIGFLAFIATIAICCFYSRYKRQLRKHQPVKIIEAPVRAYIPASLPPGSIHGVHGAAPSISGSDGRVLYDWQESTIPMDVASYRSLPNN